MTCEASQGLGHWLMSVEGAGDRGVTIGKYSARLNELFSGESQDQYSLRPGPL